MMDAIQLHARAENGRILIELPREHAGFANSGFLVLLVPDAAAASTIQPRFKPTDWEALQKAWDKVIELNPYRDIEDPVQWQRDLRAEWDRPLPGRP